MQSREYASLVDLRFFLGDILIYAADRRHLPIVPNQFFACLTYSMRSKAPWGDRGLVQFMQTWRRGRDWNFEQHVKARLKGTYQISLS